MNEPVKHVVVLGGGTSGWMSACYIQRILSNLKVPGATVTLVESEDIGIIGVGGATLNDLKNTLRFIGVDEASFMINTHATFKNGIKFVNWRDDPPRSASTILPSVRERADRRRHVAGGHIWSALRADHGFDMDYCYLTGPRRSSPTGCGRRKLPTASSMKGFSITPITSIRVVRTFSAASGARARGQARRRQCRRRGH